MLRMRDAVFPREKHTNWLPTQRSDLKTCIQIPLYRTIRLYLEIHMYIHKHMFVQQ